ncbi:MAG TPA: CPBP family intramembrane glutamic endopeptidase [Chitinophagaceae bacterium]|jgi:membrane protease YdiL (CAAX protease family)|nr:CPBP family intramembrane glutamic endopeptidase [Chitinophagaceae bacterium]
MRGLLKGKPAGTQFLIFISITLASFFLLGIAGTIILSQVTGMGLLEMSDSSKWNYADGQIVTVIRAMQAIQLVCLFLVPTYLCASLFSTDSKKYLGLKAPSNGRYYIAGIVILLLAIPLTNLLGELNRSVRFPAGVENWMKTQEEEAAKSFKLLLSDQSVTDLILNIFFIAGFAAVGEELLFRGLAQRLLIRLFKSPLAGILIASFLFSAMHMQFYGFLPRFTLGILLGLVYWYSGSLWVSILAHFVYDTFLIIIVYKNPALLNDENALKLSNIALAGGISVALVTALVVWMKKRSTVTYENVFDGDAVKNHPFDFEQNTPV